MAGQGGCGFLTSAKYERWAMDFKSSNKFQSSLGAGINILTKIVYFSLKTSVGVPNIPKEDPDICCSATVFKLERSSKSSMNFGMMIFWVYQNHHQNHHPENHDFDDDFLDDDFDDDFLDDDFLMMIFLMIIKILDDHQKIIIKIIIKNHHQNHDFGYLMMSISQIWIRF